MRVDVFSQRGCGGPKWTAGIGDLSSGLVQDRRRLSLIVLIGLASVAVIGSLLVAGAIEVPSFPDRPPNTAASIANLQGGLGFPPVAVRGTPTMSQPGDAAQPYALPVGSTWLSERALERPHHDYAAWDVPVPVGTAVRAVRAGTVDNLTEEGRCGVGVEISGTDDATYTYCHGSEVLVEAGDRVDAGERLMLSGNSGHPTGPHLHLQIRMGGTLVCPQPLLEAWSARRWMSPTEAPSEGCFYIPTHPDRARGKGAKEDDTRSRQRRKQHEAHPGRPDSAASAPSTLTRPGPSRPATPPDGRDGGRDGGSARSPKPPSSEPPVRQQPTPAPEPSPQPSPVDPPVEESPAPTPSPEPPTL